MRSRFHRNGRAISYLEASGPGPATPPRTLVLLHAFPLSAEMWQPQLDAALDGWRLVAPDLRGFGRSAGADLGLPLSMDDHARDVVALLDHLGVDRAAIAGLSMGGYVAFALLRLASARVAGLVLADTRPEADDEAARANRDKLSETLAQGGAAAVIERLVPSLLGATTRDSRPGVVRRVRELAEAQSAGAIGAAIGTLKSRPDSTPLLSGISCPTLIVVGDEDQITNVEVARRMHAPIAGADLAVIEGAGHLSSLERPETFNAALIRHLKRCQL